MLLYLGNPVQFIKSDLGKTVSLIEVLTSELAAAYTAHDGTKHIELSEEVKWLAAELEVRMTAYERESSITLTLTGRASQGKC